MKKETDLILSNIFFSVCPLFISSYNIALLSAERQIAINNPLKYNSTRMCQNLPWLFLAEWLVVCCAMIMLPFSSSTEGMLCQVSSNWTESAVWPYIPIYQATVSILIPVFIMVICYGRAWLFLQRSSNSLRESGVRAAHDRNLHNLRMAQTNIFRTCTLVLLVFLVCWIPSEIAFVMYALGYTTSRSAKLFYRIGLMTIYLNSGLNPYIYAYRYKLFIQQLKVLCAKAIGKDRVDMSSFDVHTRTQFDTTDSSKY